MLFYERFYTTICIRRIYTIFDLNPDDAFGCERIFVSMDKKDPRGALLIQARKHGCSREKLFADLAPASLREGQIFLA